MKSIFKSLLIVSILLLSSCTSTEQESTSTTEIVPGIPVKNTVTMVDLGSDTCVPCKLMAPILEEVKNEYKGRAAVIYIDVLKKEHRDKGAIFSVVTIPTQVFYDRQGQEIYRHVGFLDKDSITTTLDELLDS